MDCLPHAVPRPGPYDRAMPTKKPAPDLSYIHPSLRHLAVPIDSLAPDPANARAHPPENVAATRASLERFGMRLPIVVQKQGMIVRVGNSRLSIARDLGWTHLPAIVVDEADVEAIAFAIADNRTAELARWDIGNLRLALDGLDEEVRIDIGFDAGSIVDIVGETARAGKTDEDDVPPPPKTPITRRGDLIVLGDHRLLCGDSTADADVDRLMNGAVARMVFTDPPWNVGIGTDGNPRHKQRPGLHNDAMTSRDFASFLSGFAGRMRRVVDGDVYVILGAAEWPTLDRQLRDAGFHWSASIMWVKDIFVLGRSKYHRRYEPIWYGWPESSRSSFNDRRDLDDVWEIPRPRRSDEHPTMKPVELVARAVQNSSLPGDVVVDLFGGAGSTLIACEKFGRRCYSMEIEPVFCDVIVDRWEKFTGRKAERPAREKAPAEAGAA